MINLLQNAETTDSPPPKEEEADDSVIDLTRVEQALVDRAVAESLEVFYCGVISRSPKSLSEAILMLEMVLKREYFEYEVRREFVFL